MGSDSLICVSVLLALAAGCIVPAQACALPHPPVTLTAAKEAKGPRLGLVGKIKATYVADETRQYGEAIVAVDVVKDFSGKLPRMIFVLSPGDGMCVSVGGPPGEQVITIVRRGDDGLFHLDY